MKKILILALAVILVSLAFCFDSVEAKKGGKSKGLSADDVTAMSATVDTLTKKMYANGLFSPTDNENLIDIKIKLDNQMLVSPDASLAPLYYKVGVLYKSREMKDEAIECFQAIADNFPDTAIAPRAGLALKSLGVSVNIPQKGGSGDEE